MHTIHAVLSREDLMRGTFAGTACGSELGEIQLAKDSGGRFLEQGSYESVPIAAGLHGRWYVSWRPRWTTPVTWHKHPGNPVLTASPPPFWDAGSLTTASVVSDRDRLRLYYGSRPRGIGVASATWNALQEWTKSPVPVFGEGSPGAFDAGGVNAPRIFRITAQHWHLYYVGYDPTKTLDGVVVHQIGLAESDDAGDTWRRSALPVIPHGERGDCDAFSSSSASVLRIGDQWLLWYGGISQVPYLAGICLATSSDGHVWTKYPKNPVLNFNPYLPAEAFVVAKPQVLFEEGIFKMWYSGKGFGEGRLPGDYRICYAESRDGIHWDRFPGNPVLMPSAEGWDRTMVEYAEVLHDGSRYHMWFCGDGYGQIGYAAGESRASASVQTRSGATPVPDDGWSEWSAPHATPEGSPLDVLPGGFVQIRLTLRGSAPDWSPQVQDLKITKTPLYASERHIQS